MHSQEYNHNLALWQKNEPAPNAGANNIQVPGQTENVIYQTRTKVPSPYEVDLADSLLAIFADDIEDIEDIVDALNQRGQQTENGEQWNVSNFQTEMKRLGM